MGGKEELGGVERVVTAIECREEGMEAPANVQQEVDAEAARWKEIWTAADGVEQCRWPEDMEAPLPRIGEQQIRDAIGTFADGVGLGWDRMHPKALRRLPGKMLERLGQIFNEAEERGSWGEEFGVVITSLIPKSGGGLGLLGCYRR